MKLAILLLPFIFAFAQCSTTCTVCKMTVSAMVTWYKTNGPTDDEVFLKALLQQCTQLSSSTDVTNCKTFANCQYHKIHGDIHDGSQTIERTCIDIGSCSGPLSSDPSLTIVDWTGETSNYQPNRCVPVTFLVLHHTVTHSALETLNILNARGLSVQYIAEKNGTIYQMVHDYYRAWHAGTSYWGDYSDLNSWSVGVEIVNTGDEPFPKAQMDGVIKLSKELLNRWHISPHNIVGHFDIHPEGKNDPSGYFDWKYYYDNLGLYEEIWPSDLTDAQKKKVLQSADKYDASTVMQIQQKLRDFGYKGSLEAATGNYLTETRNTVQAFNRHWCPEVFVPEKVDYTTNSTVINPDNQRWYGISEERLNKLIQTL